VWSAHDRPGFSCGCEFCLRHVARGGVPVSLVRRSDADRAAYLEGETLRMAGEMAALRERVRLSDAALGEALQAISTLVCEARARAVGAADASL